MHDVTGGGTAADKARLLVMPKHSGHFNFVRLCSRLHLLSEPRRGQAVAQ